MYLDKETERLREREERGIVETELHFLTQCTKYKDIRQNYFKKIGEVLSEFLLASRGFHTSLEKMRNASSLLHNM